MRCTRRSFVEAAAGVVAATMLSACGHGDDEQSGDGGDAAQQGGTTGDAGSAPAEPEDPIKRQVEGMSLEQKAGQLIMAMPEGLLGVLGANEGVADTEEADAVTSVSSDLRKALSQYPVGGFCLFASNIVGDEQTRSLIKDLLAASKEVGAHVPALVGVDEEGGSLVARIANSGVFDVEQFPNMAVIGAEGDPSAARNVGKTIGSYLQDIGFTVDFAPDADVLTNPDNSVIGPRSFGSDPELVASMVGAEVEGFGQTGVACCAKHFPGHGDTEGDSHTGKAVTTRTRQQLEECEYLPFKAAIEAGIPMIMVGHISVPDITGDDTPATLSPDIIDGVLRQELGYDGLVVSDAMNMAAIGNDHHSDEAAVLFLKAGGDLVLMPNSLTAAYQGIVDAVKDGTLTEDRVDQSVYRVLKVKQSCGLI